MKKDKAKDSNSNKEKESFFKSFIPQKISNKSTLSFLQLLRKIAFHKFPGNLEKNTHNFKNHLQEIEKNNGYIENQHDYTDMYYGNKTISFCGCEIIATFNAIYDIKGYHYISFPEMINDFEKDGIILSGFFGTSPIAIEDYLNKKGFKTISSDKKEEYDKIGEIASALILTFYNDKNDIFNMIHTINITKKEGNFYIHNNGDKCYLEPYISISDLLFRINNGNAKDIFLIGILE